MAQPNLAGFGYANVGLGMGMWLKILQMWIGVGNKDLGNPGISIREKNRVFSLNFRDWDFD